MNNSTFYRGYVPTKGKKSIMKFKDVPDQELLSEAAADDLSEYAGVLAADVILVDVDDLKMSDVMFQIIKDRKIRCRVYKTTRGKHFLFRNRKESGDFIQEKQLTKVKLACGLIADLKAGCNNGLEVLRYNGQDREILLDEDPEPLPFIFWPVIDAKCDLWQMKNGEGRNDALFSYMINCMRSGMNESQVRTLYHDVINKFIFADPMDEKELNGILRDEAFEKILVKKNKPNLRLIADLIIAKDHVVRCGDQLYIYQKAEGFFSADKNMINRRMLHYVPNLNRFQRKDIYEFLSLEAPEMNVADKRFILFKNGIYDSVEDKLINLSPDYLIPNRIPWNFNPDADGEQMDEAIQKWCCNDEGIYDLLEEMIGCCLYRENIFRMGFILVGNKRNGKSKFLKVLTDLIGECNTSAVSLHQLEMRFRDSLLYGKLLNAGDDIGDGVINASETLRKLISGDPVSAEFKGRDAFQYSSYATLIFSANVIPVIRDPTGAVKDRMIIIPFNAHFEEGAEGTDPNIMDVLLTDDNMEYLAFRGLVGLQRLLKNEKFTRPKAVVDAMKKYRLNADHIGVFLEDNADRIRNQTTDDVYMRYIRFCTDQGINPSGKEMLSRRIHQLLDHETSSRVINGKSVRIYK